MRNKVKIGESEKDEKAKVKWKGEKDEKRIKDNSKMKTVNRMEGKKRKKVGEKDRKSGKDFFFKVINSERRDRERNEKWREKE